MKHRLLALVVLGTSSLAPASLVIDFHAPDLASGSRLPAGDREGRVAQLRIVTTTKGVRMELENLSPATSSQKVGSLMLNLQPGGNAAGWSNSSGAVKSMAITDDRVNGLGGERFDVGVGFHVSNGGALSPGKTAVWEITGTGLTAGHFDALSSGRNGGHLALLHLQGLADGSSVKLYGRPVEAVPEPATLAALAVGAASLLARRRRS